MSEIATENADRRISELLLLNETLRQQNHNVQEEIFDLKMCMATTEVESTSAIKKELDALKSQMAFKEREMQELQRDAAQTKRTLHEQASAYSAANKKQHIAPSTTTSSSSSAGAPTGAPRSQNIPTRSQPRRIYESISVSEADTDPVEQLKLAKRQWEEKSAAEKRRRDEIHQAAGLRDRGLAAQEELMRQYVLGLCHDVSVLCSEVAAVMPVTPCSAENPSARQSFRAGVGAGAGASSRGKASAVLAKLRLILNPESEVEAVAADTHSPPRTQASPRVQPVLGWQRAPQSGVAWSHKYCTGASEKARLDPPPVTVTVKPPSLSSTLPAQMVACVNSVADSLRDLQDNQSHTLNAVVSGSLLSDSPLALTPIDLLLYALCSLAQSLTQLAGGTEGRTEIGCSDPIAVAVLPALKRTLAVISRLMCCCGFRVTDSQGREGKRKQDQGQGPGKWRRVVANSHLISCRRDSGSKISGGSRSAKGSSGSSTGSNGSSSSSSGSGGSEGVSEDKTSAAYSELNFLLQDTTSSVLRGDKLNLVTLGGASSFSDRVVRVLCEVGEVGIERRCGVVVQGVSEVLSSVLQMSVRSLERLPDWDREGERERDEEANVVHEEVASALSLLFAPLFLPQYGVLVSFLVLGSKTVGEGHAISSSSSRSSSSSSSSSSGGGGSGSGDVEDADSVDGPWERGSTLYGSSRLTAGEVSALWLLELLPVPSRTTLLALVTRLVALSERVFGLFLNQQQRLGVGSAALTAEKSGDMSQGAQSVCSRLLECLRDFSQSSSGAGQENSDREKFRHLTVRFFVTLLAGRGSVGAHCVLGQSVTTPLHSTHSPLTCRSRALALYRTDNASALRFLRLLVELVWRSVLEMDSAPSLSQPPSLRTDSTTDVISACDLPSSAPLEHWAADSDKSQYFVLKARLVKDCALLLELIHGSVCAPPSSSLHPSFAELTKLAGCADLFANLLFRMYKQRVHSWLGGGVFEGVMDIYDEG